MNKLKTLEAWFITGSQHLYGEETLKQVAEHSKKIAKTLNGSKDIPVKVKFKPVLKSPEEIYNLCREANADENCIGLIAWMHTFSPAKMWINGLKILKKPMAHLHTQFNRDIPWSEIDMDFMNLQSIGSRRARIWLYQYPDATQSQGGCRALAGQGSSETPRCLDPGGRSLEGNAKYEGRPLWR